MTQPARLRSLLAAIAIALFAVPAAAMANPLGLPLPFHLPAGTPPQLRALVRSRVEPIRPPAPFRPEFQLKTRNGYQVGVIGSGRAVLVEVGRIRGRLAAAATVYIARGRVTRHRLEASFGELGSIAMRFQPSGGRTSTKPHRACHGPSTVADRHGVFVGAFHFTGEGEYVSVHAHRVKGKVSSLVPRCRGGHAGRRADHAMRPAREEPKSPPPAFLDASWRHAVDGEEFIAVRGGEKALFLALDQRSEGSMARLHLALAFGTSKAFSIDNALTLAQVSPPPPFAGTGTYTAAPDGTTTWTGSLSVDYPGTGQFPLTGPPYEAVVGAGF